MNDLLLMSVHPEFYESSDVCDTFYEERRQFFKTEGIDLKYVCPKEFDIMGTINLTNNRTIQAKTWIRDVFQIINKKLLISPSHKELTPQLEKIIGMNSKSSSLEKADYTYLQIEDF